MFLSDNERKETIWACRFCPMCHVADRVAAIIGRESYTPRGRGAILEAYQKKVIELDSTVSDIFYTTLNDGLIREWCVGHYDHEELVIDTRAKLFQEGLAPEDVYEYTKSLAKGTSKRSPCTILDEMKVTVTEDADTLLFCGCTALESSPSLIWDAGRILNAAGIPFKVLQSEACCGWPFYQLGDFDSAKQCSTVLSEAIRDSGVRNVFVLDADCYRMLLTRTVRFGGRLNGINIQSILDPILMSIREGRLEVTPIQMVATYHDPCAFARYLDEIETPREIFRQIIRDPLREMPTHGKLANCCGSGGMLPVVNIQLAEAVSAMRLKEAVSTGAEVMVTACPRCDRSFASAKASQSGLKIFNIVNLVASAAGLSHLKVE